MDTASLMDLVKALRDDGATRVDAWWTRYEGIDMERQGAEVHSVDVVGLGCGLRVAVEQAQVSVCLGPMAWSSMLAAGRAALESARLASVVGTWPGADLGARDAVSDGLCWEAAVVTRAQALDAAQRLAALEALDATLRMTQAQRRAVRVVARDVVQEGVSSAGDRWRLAWTDFSVEAWVVLAINGALARLEAPRFFEKGGWEALERAGWQLESWARSLTLAERAGASPTESGPVVLAPEVVAVLAHESLVHGIYPSGASLGWEGTRVASGQINVDLDTSGWGAAGAGCDHRGVAGGIMPLIVAGYVREATEEDALGWGRSDDLDHDLFQRMPDVCVHAGGASWRDLLARAEGGLYLLGPRSWWVSEDRRQMHLGCELALRIRDGALAEAYRFPALVGDPLGWWRACHGVGHAELVESIALPCALALGPAQLCSHRVPPLLLSEATVHGAG